MPKEIKTDAQWDSINFKNSLGPQIGGLLHDSCALAIAELNKYPIYETTNGSPKIAKNQKIEERIIYWLDTLYEIAEQKKKEILTPNPLNEDKAVKLGKDWQKKNKRAYSDVKSPKWNDGATEKEQLEIQEEMNDVNPEIREERLFEEKQRSQTESKAF